MAVWPFIPRDEFTESLEWVTDVIRPFSTEQRIRLTSAPRQRFNFTHALSPRQYARARAMMIGGAASSWTVPMWHEKQDVTVSAGATSITVDTTSSDYRVGGTAVLWTDDENYESVTISVVASGSLTVSAIIGNYSSALIMPGVTARMIGAMDTTRTVDSYVSASVEWLVYEGKDLASSSLYSTTHRTYAVIDDPAVIGSASVNERIEWPQDVVDNGLASAYHDTAQDRAAANFAAAWYTTTQATLRSLRGFLHSLYGRQKGFWIPDWHNGFSVQANITSAGTTITILAVGLNGNIETGDLMVQTTAGAQHYFQYTSVAPSGANEVLTLSAAAGVNITTAEIARCCLLHFCRLAQDRVELIHRNPGHCAVMVSCDEVPIP